MIVKESMTAAETDDAEQNAPVTLAVFYPDGAAEAVRWRLRSGRATVYCELSGMSGELTINDAPLSEWRREEE